MFGHADSRFAASSAGRGKVLQREKTPRKPLSSDFGHDFQNRDVHQALKLLFTWHFQ